MADEQDEFAVALADKSGMDEFEAALNDNADVKDVKLPRSTPLTDFERLALQNVFDTQPKKRAAFARQIGIELDPNDTNKFRPLGSQGEYHGEIDPGVSAYFSKGGLKELYKDLTDIGVDTASSIAAIGPAAVKGAALGSVVPGLGTAVGGALGAILGGAAGNYATEEIKNGLANVLLDEEIPMDRKETAVQSMIVGVAPQLLKGGQKVAGKVTSALIETRRNAIKEALKLTGQASDEVIEQAALNPERFQPEVVKGGNKRFSDFYKGFFGLDPEDDLAKKVASLDSPPSNSEFGKMLAPIKGQQQTELAKLTVNPEASVPFEQMASGIRTQIAEITSKGNPTLDELEALKVLRGQLQNLTKIATDKVKAQNPGAPVFAKDLNQVPIDHGAAREYLKGLQSRAFKKTDIGTMSENPILSKVAGTMRRDLDEVATRAGSTLPQLNAQIAEGMETFKMAASNLKPQQLIRSFVGGENQARQETQVLLNRMDRTLGSNYSKQFEDGALDSMFEQMYSKAVPKGSSQVNQMIARETAKGALKGAGAGLAVGGAGSILGGGSMAAPAAVIGAVAGGAMGASRGATMADPGAALRSLAPLAEKAAGAINLAERPLKYATERVPSLVVGQGLSKPDELPVDEEDEFSRALK